MANAVSKLLQVSTVMMVGGVVVLTALTSNCGGGGDRTGTAGIVGSAGTSGNAGATGNAGNTGAGGTGGGAMALVCAPSNLLNCTAGNAKTIMTDGQITAFDTEEWSSTGGKWCNASGLRGSIFGYQPAANNDPNGSGAASVVTNGLQLNLTVNPGGYAGGGLAFDSCVNASNFGGLSFTASLVSGSLAGCVWQVQLQTQEQRPISQMNPSGGTCDPDAGASCYRFPAATNLTAPTGTTPIPLTAMFSGFGPAAVGAPAQQQIVGIQWQANSAPPADPDGGSQLGCTAVLRIDDIKFIP